MTSRDARTPESRDDELERPDWGLGSTYRDVAHAEEGDSMRVADPGTDQLEQFDRRQFLGRVQEQSPWIGEQPLVTRIVGQIDFSRVLVIMIRKCVNRQNLVTKPIPYKST